MCTIKKIVASIAVLLSVLLPVTVQAQIVPAQNQQIVSPYGGFVVATSTSGTSKLSATTTPFFNLGFSFAATSTGNNGINLTHGCFSINNVCLGSSSGTVTSVSGLYPVLSSGGNTPVISLAFGTTTSNVWAGTQTFTNAPIFSSLTGLLKGNGSSALTVGVNGTDYTLITAKTCTAGDFVSAVTAAGIFTCTTPAGTTYTGTFPINVSGSVISFGGLSTSTPAVVGNIPYFSGVNTFANVATSTLTATSPLTGSFTHIGTTGSLGCQTASGSQAGCLSSTDWNTFNNKQATLAFTWPLINTANTVTFGGLSTSTPAVVGNIPYFSGVNTFANVATTTRTYSGPFTITGTLGAQVGGTNSVVTWSGLATTTQPSSSNLLVSNGAAGVYGVATTSVSCSGGTTCTAFTAIGASPITISSSASSAFPFTPTTNFAAATNATGTPLWFQAGFQASTTSRIASTTFTGIGAVGINLATPGASLEIQATSTSSTGNAFIAWDSALKNIFQIRNDGVVGIGTANPTEVNANSRLTIANIGAISVVASTTDNTTSSASIYDAYAPGARAFIGAHGTNQIVSRYGLTLGGWGEVGVFNSSFGTANGLVIGTQPAIPLVFGTNSIERVRILSGGNVGIGTTTPWAKLSINNSTNDTAGQPLFAIASSTATATTTLFSVSNTGAIQTALGTGCVQATSGLLSITSACGSVTSLSVSSANGFAGSFTAGATPVLTLSTTITGLLKGNGTAISAAAYTDFPTIAAGTVLANGTGATAAPTAISTSTLYGTCSGGQVVGWSNTINGLGCIATSTPTAVTPGGTGTEVQYRLTSTTFGAVASSAYNSAGGLLSFGTTSTGNATVTIGTSSAPQLRLSSNSLTANQWTFGVDQGGVLSIGTSSPATFATSTVAAVQISQAASTMLGVATSSPWRTLSVTGTVALDGLTTAAGTPSSICMNATTKEVTVNAALTCTVSSRKFKLDIDSLQAPGLTTLEKITPAQFAYKDVPSRMRWGFIAEDIAMVDSKLADGYDEQGNPNSIDQNAILAVTVKALQEQQKEIENIKGTAENNWQWLAIGLLALLLGYQQIQIQRIKKSI